MRYPSSSFPSTRKISDLMSYRFGVGPSCVDFIRVNVYSRTSLEETTGLAMAWLASYSTLFSYSYANIRVVSFFPLFFSLAKNYFANICISLQDAKKMRRRMNWRRVKHADERSSIFSPIHPSWSCTKSTRNDYSGCSLVICIRRMYMAE